MTTHLYLAPAGHGKTTYVLRRIRQARAELPLAPIAVILPNQAQVHAFRRRLSAGGGALGVNLGTFYTLYPEILAWAGQPQPRLPEPVQFRLLRHIVAQLSDDNRLTHYAPLRDKPGFVVALRALVEELKRARIHRDDFERAIQTLPHSEARLTELVDIYTAYQNWLLAQGWADTEGQGWLAASTLERRPELGRHLRLLIVDGFDEFNPSQLAVLNLLAARAAETLITLTGAPGENSRPAFRRFDRALRAVGQALDLRPEPLPEPAPMPFAPALAHLERHLFTPRAAPLNAENEPDAITFMETQNRAEEVRAALRWLKARLARDSMAPSEVALIARSLTPYRPFIEETAAEFGLTVTLREGLPLAANPAIAALMSLLALPLPNHPQGSWPRRPLLDAWRSPYFKNPAPEGLTDLADHLDRIARQGLVIHGLGQWREAFAQQLGRVSRPKGSAALEDEGVVPAGQLSSDELLALQAAFDAFVERLSPPPRATLRDYAAFVEDLIGNDPKLSNDASYFSPPPSLEENQPTSPPPLEENQPTFPPFGGGEGGLSARSKNTAYPLKNGEIANSLNMVTQAWAVAATAPRDIAALRAFKDTLRGLVLAGAALNHTDEPALSYADFYAELQGAVQGTVYYLPPPDAPETVIPALSALDARGLSFRAAALIGLAEGEFPRAEREDVLLREEDRAALRRAGLPALEQRLRGDEMSLFYLAVTRTREKLFLCRPYLADDGQPWEPSLYWQQTLRLIGTKPRHLRPEDPLPLADVASTQELVQTGLPLTVDVPEFEPLPPAAVFRVRRGLDVLAARLAGHPQGIFEGDLSRLSGQLAAAYGPDHIWSSSRLEAYGLCPHHFWLWQDLGLEPRQPPQEGFDIFILGSMYHEILENVYAQAGEQAGANHLPDLLPAVARDVFDRAPAEYGFRPTPLWQMQRVELEQIVADTLTALIEATAGSAPLAQEQAFGLDEQPPLVVRRGDDEFRARGFIDRVDQLADGRLRIIDYKSGATPIAARDLLEGRRLQIALYALAARDALALGNPADGFYWHIGSAKPSSLRLEKFEGGLEGALNIAVEHVFRHIAGVRAGQFPPLPPKAGCPGHCPGAAFCWRYQTKGW